MALILPSSSFSLTELLPTDGLFSSSFLLKWQDKSTTCSTNFLNITHLVAFRSVRSRGGSQSWRNRLPFAAKFTLR
ncbi:hypothetical protein LINGRAHAP2_LOCUS9098 [Linum grandiflorum]